MKVGPAGWLLGASALAVLLYATVGGPTHGTSKGGREWRIVEDAKTLGWRVEIEGQGWWPAKTRTEAMSVLKKWLADMGDQL